ncbi:MAG: zinc-ribbon domain-containing protein [Evtepia gabavorous]
MTTAHEPAGKHCWEEWDVEGNGALTPLALSHGSRQKVWWRCRAGAPVAGGGLHRTGAESGCPYCAGKRPWPGFNDLASQEPALAAQWHPERNGPLTPDQVVCGSTPAGVVAVRQWARLGRVGEVPGGGRRLPLLYRPADQSRGK